MRYQFIGFPVPYKGKTIWEIIGNLKNLGVGRYIVADEHKDQFEEPCFYKIVRAVPMETPKAIGANRGVLVWAEYVLRGRKLTELEQLEPESRLTKFHLIPKEDETKYLSGITDNPKLTIHAKYQPCPPLFKKIWEQRQFKKTRKYSKMPKVETIIDTGEKSFEILSTDDITEAVAHTDLYKTDIHVEDMYKKIYILRKKLGIVDKVDESK